MDQCHSGGANLELTLSSSINLTADTKYWIVPIPADGHGSNLGFKYKCGDGGRYISWNSVAGESNPTTPPSNWTSLPKAYNFSFTNCNLGYYAVTGDTTESMADPIATDKDVVGSIDTQSQLAKSSITQSTSTVSSRLSYLRQNKDNQNLSKIILN